MKTAAVSSGASKCIVTPDDRGPMCPCGALRTVNWPTYIRLAKIAITGCTCRICTSTLLQQHLKCCTSTTS